MIKRVPDNRKSNLRSKSCNKPDPTETHPLRYESSRSRCRASASRTRRCGVIASRPPPSTSPIPTSAQCLHFYSPQPRPRRNLTKVTQSFFKIQTWKFSTRLLLLVFICRTPNLLNLSMSSGGRHGTTVCQTFSRRCLFWWWWNDNWQLVNVLQLLTSLCTPFTVSYLRRRNLNFLQKMKRVKS